MNNNVFNNVTLFTVAGCIASVVAALFLPPGSILTPIVYTHSEMPYTVFLRAVSSQGRRGHEYSYTFIRQSVGLFLTSSFLTSSSVYVLTLANACNGGRRKFFTCSMHMQLGVTYHISKGASKNGLPVKYTLKKYIFYELQSFQFNSNHFI